MGIEIDKTEFTEEDFLRFSACLEENLTALCDLLARPGFGAQILAALGVHEMTLLSNSPSPKVVGLEGYGLRIVERVPLETGINAHNLTYLRTKRARMGHELTDSAVAMPVEESARRGAHAPVDGLG